MATVTGLTAQRMLEIEAMSIVNGGIDLVTGRLKLERHDGGIVDAGDVRGVGLTPDGDTGEVLFKKSPNDFDTEWRGIDASDVLSGQFAPERIPQLKASEGKVDVLYNDTNPITILRSVPGSNVVGGALFLSLYEFGAIFDNVWKVRFDSSGTLTNGSIPGPRITGGPGSIDPFVVPCINHDGSTTVISADRAGVFSGSRIQLHTVTGLGLHLASWNQQGLANFAFAQDEYARYVQLPSIYARGTTQPANVHVADANGTMFRTTSVASAKVAVEDAPASWLDGIWSLRPRTWFDKADADLLASALDRQADGEEVEWDNVLASPLRRIPGFVAEEVEEAGLEEFLLRDETGALTGLAYDRLSAALLVAMKDERERRIALESTVLTLAEKIKALEARLPEEPAPADN